ncbi:hypothetical protein EJ08DRAFT_734715 [Tothia fuscella]|uniref:BTB domain-containing protein n=1 Tax=Tothia fuscella TaxID=1048955 RepID=A0A9P4NQR9_9PEZI|nr:hypothetical protein EJ08DRAFT_734715 [Tothia fuscella]
MADTNQQGLSTSTTSAVGPDFRIGGHVAGLQRIWESGDYSDIIIRHEHSGKEWKLHKVILCAHSEFFAAALRENTLKEGEMNVLSVDSMYDEEATTAMIEFMYRLQYDDTNREDCPMVFNVRVYTIADYYLMPGLRALALEKFATLSDAGGWNSVDFVYAIELAYSFKLYSESSFRELVSKISVRHMHDLLRSSHGFNVVLQEYIEFAQDVVNIQDEI